MLKQPIRVAVLVSGGGSNLQAIIDHKKQGFIPNGEFCCVISSKPDVYALERAKQEQIPTKVLARKAFDTPQAFDAAVLAALIEVKADLVVLAGFLSILGEKVIARYQNRIINVHPSLIPSFCGKGFYGLRVHQAALDYGVKVTGATVHFVNEVPDGGKIILQKAVEIEDGDTASILQKRVMEQAEWIILPKAVQLLTDTMKPIDPLEKGEE